MSDYGRIYADWRIHLLYSCYLRIGGSIVAKGTAVADAPPTGAVSTPNGVPSNLQSTDSTRTDTNGMATLPTGFRRLSDLRKPRPKQSYDDLKAWVGKMIRLDDVKIQTGEKDGKTVLIGGTMTFSEFNPENPDQETDQAITTQIPRSALRAIYQGLSANPDETIVCEVTQGKRGIALQ